MTRDEVLASKKYLSLIGQWPKIPARANPERWLDGFPDDDEDFALALLESLVYFSMEQTTKLSTSLFHSLSSEVTQHANSYAARKELWLKFLDECLVTFPTGETPNPTDSGHTFARLARQELSIREDQLLYPQQVVELLYGRESRPVVIIDDFAGSGEQFMKTWQRLYSMPDGQRVSFHQIVSSSNPKIFYIPTVATSYALERIKREAPLVNLRSAHILSERYSAVGTDSVVFPPQLRDRARDFIRRSSETAGISPQDQLGFHCLALAIGFEHSVPDATLPIIWKDTQSWHSLLRRS